MYRVKSNKILGNRHHPDVATIRMATYKMATYKMATNDQLHQTTEFESITNHYLSKLISNEHYFDMLSKQLGHESRIRNSPSLDKMNRPNFEIL
jgi:hypothetical protein